MGGGQNFPDDVENRVVFERIANLLKFFQQSLKNPTLDGVRRNKIEDQTIMLLAVPMDAAHTLLKAIRVPGNVVIEQDVAALEVDAFAGCFGGGEDLNRAVFELLFGIEAGIGFLARAWLHPAVNAADLKSPIFQAGEKIVECIFVFGEDE